jgi:hypothetical protein
MKRPDNTEMDRLLHRFARRNAETVRDGNGKSSNGQDASGNTHLDTDELNAYAEGALPESARSRYFAHLADCDTCRKLVTDLTLAATVSSQQKERVAATTTSPAKSWRDWLAALLSPPVLRYGVPALALFAIIVVAIVATRTRRDTPSFVAQDSDSTRTYPSATTSNSNTSAETTTAQTTVENHAISNSATSNTAPSVQSQNAAPQASPPENPVQEKDKNIARDTPTVAQTEVATSTAGQRGSDTKQPAPGNSGKVLDEAVTIAPAVPPAQAPVLTTSSTTANEAESKREERKRAQNKEDDDQVTTSANVVGGATAPQSSVNGARDTSGRRAARTAQNLPATKPASPKSEASDIGLAKDSSTETRNVQGHKFRKQGNAWVDTAYNSSLSTTNVARGSEQYRALIADEPGLRTITQQLGGQVIVVWKGRAYRFY